MPDWTKSMQQSFEYYIVDPGTWKDKTELKTVKTCTINRDADAETRGSATFAVTDKPSECYIRTYLVTVQNGVKERHALGTHLIQTPSSKFNGRVKEINVDAYTPLLELKGNQPPMFYFIPKGENVMENAYRIIRENARAPVAKATSPTKTEYEYTANEDDTWLSYLSDLIANQVWEDETTKKTRINRYILDVDEMGSILFSPVQDVSLMQHRWEFKDDDGSILHPDISMEHDLYNIPNVVEVKYSMPEKNINWFVRIVNDDENSEISVPRRGREVVRRVVNPTFPAPPKNEDEVYEFAKELLKELSSIQCTVTYTHGYCPVRVGDCVLLNYERAGIKDIRAKVVHQNIKCVPGCPVTEKAVFTIKLWEGNVTNETFIGPN